MSDSVKFIFKCIIKVPIFIMISYFIANLFFFSLFYFKFLGISYSVMQTALENNYLPPTEKTALEKSLKSIYQYDDGSTSKVIPRAEVYIDNNNRKQYGKTMTVGVKYTYRWIWPLMPEEYGQTTANVDSLTGGENGLATNTGQGDKMVNGKSDLSDQQLAAKRSEKADKGTHEIQILYVVPGLQYYSDLE